jgi:hypothetical protein
MTRSRSGNQPTAVSLTPLDWADICAGLAREGMSTREIRIGWNDERTVASYLRLARARSPLLRDAVQTRRITFEVACVLLREDFDELSAHLQRRVLKEIDHPNISIADVECAMVDAIFDDDSSPSSADEPRLNEFRELADGTLEINVYLDPADPKTIDDGIAVIEQALTRMRALKKLRG